MPELRKDPIMERWVIIAPERGRRPRPQALQYELPPAPNNPFSPGNEDKTPPEVFAIRATGSVPNGPGWDVRVVPNRFPALQVEGELRPRGDGLYDCLNGIGAHEIIIESPQHDADLPDLTPEQIEKVLLAWIQRTSDLRRDVRLQYQQIFRNKGFLAGATVAHPHSQLVATPIIPDVPKAKLAAARAHFLRKGRCLFADLIDQELSRGERVVMQTRHFVVLTPYASRFPFELVVYPLRQCHDLILLDETERRDLAYLLRNLLGQLRMALDDPPYNLMITNAPSTVARPGRPDYWGTLADDFRWHLEVVPRLQQVAGFEWGTGFTINPVSPEEAAATLREGN